MAIQFEESRVPRDERESFGTLAPEIGGNPVSLAIQALVRIAEQHKKRMRDAEGMIVDQSPDVTGFARALANPRDPLAETMVADLLASGVTVQKLCAEYLAPAARELGKWWETDEMGFADVTLATGRIQAMLHNLPDKRRPTSIEAGKGAVFAAVPGEDHTLGVLIAADHFRRLGWDVGLLIGMDHAETRARILADDRPVLGLSCTSVHALDNLRRLVTDLRFRRPELAIVVSGGVAHDADVLRSLPQFDGIVTRLDGSERILRSAVRAVGARGVER